MGIFDRKKKNEPAQTPVATEDMGALGGQAARLVERILEVGIDGKGTFDSAQKIADDARRRRSDPERVIDDIVSAHLRLAAANGFVTGLGGFVTLPVALPANVAGFYIVATRMAAAIAAVRGYDIEDPSVRSALLLALVGADADDLLKKVGYSSTGRLANLAAERLPGAVLMAINKGVGFRLITKLGRSTFARAGRGVPFLGGVIGAGLDSYLLKKIADHVRQQFPVKATLTSLPTTPTS
ncbi:EcsC family protein [Mobilicoccus massiliensis]|uniref:EcsC family protein n=1 Tax=Mobilicoccus massiliensis TaxID=1522310 RepID=UPI00058DDC9E|nr:EcsC family protein [Mobilicoccus massiliensis]